ncbi:MAG: vWA domain-containing protein [Candidatus Binatia bacterium]
MPPLLSAPGLGLRLAPPFPRPIGPGLAAILIWFSATSIPCAAEEAAVRLTAPPEASAGAEINVSHGGSTAPLDFISIDAPRAADGSYGTYAYVKSGNPVKLRVPDVPGDYQVRYHRAQGYAVAGSAPLTVTEVKAALDGPAQVDAGATVEVKFSGPETAGDFISIDKAGAADRDYGPYVYAKQGTSAKLRAPDQAGAYAVRYHLGQTYRVIASAPLTVGQTTAALDAPASVAAGSEITVAWTGPNQTGDFISIDKAGAADRDYGPYAYTKDGSSVVIRVPEDPGDYAIRYRTGQTYAVVVERPLAIGAVTATLTGPAAVVAGSKFEVTWVGPNNAADYVAIAATGTPDRETLSYAYTKRGSPARLEAPKEPGTYELRYLTGQSSHVLARTPIDVSPGTVPGTLRVTSGAEKASGSGAVELILDASGSMLQRLGRERRIDLAKNALIELTRDVLPAGAPFALRVFGHREANACRSDLEIALAPLDRSAAVSTITRIEAKNLAKTPIGDSLLQVKQDLAGTQSAAIVVLVTDGEETCDGDPRAAITSLRGAGFDVRVNIVGFAVDELALKEEFETWARIGGGSYFDAADGAALGRAFRASLRLPYEVEKDGAVVATGVVNGDALELPPGRYQVEMLSNPPRRLGDVTVVSEEETLLAAE